MLDVPVACFSSCLRCSGSIIMPLAMAGELMARPMRGELAQHAACRQGQR
jgi:hypothetical protein